jgi:hypothetical protein
MMLMTKPKSTNLVFPVLAAWMLLVLTACSALPQISTVEGEDRDQVLTLAEPMADAIFQGMNEENYAKFSQDFDSSMQKALNEKSFNEMNMSFKPKIGSYQSREVIRVEVVDTIVYVVTYQAKYEKEDAVTVRLSIRQGDPAQIAGLYFDSPKLRPQ